MAAPPPLCNSSSSSCLGDLILGPEASHWSRLLVRDQLDSGSLVALSHTCTTARNLVLATAERATIQLFITTQHPNMAKLRHLNKDKQVMSLSDIPRLYPDLQCVSRSPVCLQTYP